METLPLDPYYDTLLAAGYGVCSGVCRVGCAS